MYRIGIVSVLLTIGVECATYYPRSYSDSSGYPSSTLSSLNDNYLYGKSGSYGSDTVNIAGSTRYPNYSPGYGYSAVSGYSTPAYNTGYSSTRYPGYGSNGYSTSGYNTLYGSGTNNLNYGSGSYGSGTYGSGSYGTGSYGSGSYGTGSYGSGGYGSSYGTGLGSSYGSGSTYGTGYASGYPNYGTGSTIGGNSQGGYSSYEAPFMRNQGGACVNRGPQNGIYIDGLMGMWYGVEYIQHLGVDPHYRGDESYYSYYDRTCIVIHIAEPMERPSTENQPYHQQAINAKFRQQYRHLRLLWDEAGLTTEYSLYFRNDSAGYWHVFDRQNGTMAAQHNYQHFSGTVQVLKAVNDHLVLNFCQEGNNFRGPQLYSVLFSRTPGELTRWEIESIHNMLQTKRLSTGSRRMVCGNNAEKVVHSMIFSVLTCALAYVFSAW